MTARILHWAGAAALAAGLWAVSVSACSGHSGGTCASDADCSGGQSCVGPNGPPACGIPPKHGCQTSSDCPGGEVCNAVLDACSPTGIGSTCGPPCTSTSACGTGLRCSAQGACETIPCDEGFTCAAFQRCDASVGAAHETVAVYLEDHGCESIACTTDGDCPASTFCVNAVCQSGPGSCETPMLVP